MRRSPSKPRFLRIARIVMMSILLAAGSAAAQGPVAWYPLDGNANDASGNGNNGTVNGALLTSDRFGNPNRAYYFPGTSESITIPGAPVFGFGLDRSYSISTWIKFCYTDYSRFTSPLVFIDQSPQTHSFGLMGGAGAIAVEAGFAGGAGPKLDDGRWHHVVGIFLNSASFGLPDSGAAIYVDGQLFEAYSNPSFEPILSHPKEWNNPVQVYLGSYPGGPALGALDDVRFYNRQLSPAEIQALYNEFGWPNINLPPIRLSITPSGPLTICEGDSVLLDVSVSGPGQLELQWDKTLGIAPGDLTRKKLWVRPKVSTTYTVRVNSGQPCPDRDTSASITINVNESPRINLGGARYVCEGEGPITIGDDATGGLPPYTYSWTPTTGLSNPGTARPTLTPTSGITYTLRVTDAKGCRTEQSVSVVVLPTPVLQLPPSVGVCRGDSVALDAGKGARGGYSYRWSPAAGLSDTTSAKPKASPSVTTTYTVRAEVGGCVGYDTIVVRVVDPPTADAGPDVESCRDSGVVIGRATGAKYVYIWTPTTGLDDPTSATPTAKPSVTTTYRVVVVDTTDCSAVDEVTVTVRDVRLNASRPGVDFGTLDGCTSSKDVVITLNNDGTSDITIAELVSDNPDFSVVTPTVGTIIKAGASVQLRLRYAPNGAGESIGHLTVRGAPCGTETVITVSGSKEESLVSADRSAIDFGRTLACRTIERDSVVIVSNNGTAAVELQAGLLSAPFVIVSPGLPATIPAGGSLSVVVRYAPTAAGAYSEELRLGYRSGTCEDTLRIALRGQHQQPRMTGPSAIDFGALVGCVSQQDTTIELANSGGVDVQVNSADIGNGFTLLSALPMTIPAGATKSIRLRFAPTSAGSSSGVLVLRYGPCNDSISIALSGSASGASFAMADTLDLGTIVSCAASSSTITTSLLYTGDPSTPGSVRQVRIAGPFSTSLAAGTPLVSGAARSFTVSYQPTADGAASGTLTLLLDPCGVTRTIALRGTRTLASLTATTPVVSFGTQATGSTMQRDVIFTNNGSAPLHVASIDGVAASFSVVATTPSLPADLAPGQTLHVTIQSLGTPGHQQSVVRAHVASPCDLLSEAVVAAEGISTARAALHLPMLSAAAGDHVSVPLLLDSSSGLDEAGATAFTVTISFDRSLLVAANPSTATSDGVTRRLTITGQRPAGMASGAIGSLDLIAVFGSAESTVLHIDTLIWSAATEPVAVTTADGEFRLDGICRSGGTRLYNGSGTVALKPVVPNPVSGIASVEYEVVESGRTRLVLSDLLGREVGVLTDGELAAGRYMAWIDVRGLASGYYFCVLQTPTLLLTQPMEISK